MKSSASMYMLQFVRALPIPAFNFVGDIPTEPRCLFSQTPSDADTVDHCWHGRVVCARWASSRPDEDGWIQVCYDIPPSGDHGSEAFAIRIHTSVWGTMSPWLWKGMIIRHLAGGVHSFP